MTLRSLLLLCSFPGLLACGEITGGASTGGIRITATTLGEGADLDGYLVVLDAQEIQALEPNGTATYEDVPDGGHLLTLHGLAEHCAVRGDNPRPVAVRGGEVTQVAFRIVCTPPPSGAFLIRVSTVGTDLDPDGYLLSVAGAPFRLIEINATELFEDLAEGPHLVTLKRVVIECRLEGGNPQLFFVEAGRTVQITLRVVCGGSPPPLE